MGWKDWKRWWLPVTLCVVLVLRIQQLAGCFSEATFSMITVSSWTGFGFLIEKRNDSVLAAGVNSVEAKLGSTFDFISAYEAHISLFRHFGLMCPFTPHPWHTIPWLFWPRFSPFVPSTCVVRPRPFFVTNNAASGERPFALRRVALNDSRWEIMFATVSVFSVRSSVKTKSCHSSVFERFKQCSQPFCQTAGDGMQSEILPGRTGWRHSRPSRRA